ncbi:MAG: transcription elongation factor NusA [Candidatus Hydrothermarchaeota archaeon]
MEFPVCSICVKSDLLCPGCEYKLEKGEISELDVEISRALYGMKDKYKTLRDISFKRSICKDDFVAIIIKEGKVGGLIGKGGKIIKTLSKRIGKTIRVIEDTKDEKVIAQELLTPAQVRGINIVFLPDGKERFKVRISKDDEKRLPADMKVLEEILCLLTGKYMEIVPE